MHTDITPELWVKELRKAVGTPFLHQGRVIGPDGGLDCVGLLTASAVNLGLHDGPIGIEDYAHLPDSKQFYKWCHEYLVRLPYTRIQPFKDQHAQLGDVMTFWVDNESAPRHVAVYTGTVNRIDHMIHAHAKGERGVIEQAIDLDYWEPRLHGLWRIQEFMGE